jgi:hypothetical protein
LVDKLMPAQGVGHHTFGGKKLHKDVIFPDFSAFRRTIASAPAVPPVQLPVQPLEALPPEPTNRSSPVTGAPATGQTAGPVSAASGQPATSLASKGRLAAPPFSWLGVDAWPHSPAWAEQQA